MGKCVQRVRCKATSKLRSVGGNGAATGSFLDSSHVSASELNMQMGFRLLTGNVCVCEFVRRVMALQRANNFI